MGSDDGDVRRRVFYVLDSLDDDDVGDHVATILSRLPRARFEPRVVALRDQGALGDRIREMHVTVHGFPGGGRIDLLSVPRLRKLLKTMECDVVHTFHAVSSVIAQLAVPRGMPVVRSVPGLPLETDPVEIRLAGKVEGFTSRRASVRFVTSWGGAVERVQRRFGAGEVSVVAECVDRDSLRREIAEVSGGEARIRLGLSDGQRLVVAFTDFHDRQMAEALLDGLATARTERPDTRLFLVGKGGAEGHARGYAEILRLDDAVVFIRDDNGLPDLMAAADLVVDAHEWPAPSRGALKASALDLPVVYWTNGQEAGDLDDALPGIAGVPESFAAELVRLLNDAKAKTALVDRSRTLARDIAVADVAARWADVYDEVLGAPVRDVG